jgi:HEAT repeat protein
MTKDESDPEFLVKAINVMGEMKEKNAIAVLTEKLDHPEEEVRIAAAYALKSAGGASAKEKMIKKLKEQKLEFNSNFTDALLSALGEFNAREIIPLATEALSSNKTSRGNKENLMIFVGKIRAKEAKDVLIKLYTDDDEDLSIRALAVNALAKMELAEIAPRIKKVIETIESYDIKKRKKYYTLHLYSVAALARLGDADSVPKLIKALRSNNSEVRLKAVSLIKEFKDKRTIDILKYKLKYDQSPKVRAEAKKALEEQGVDVKGEKK